MRQTIQTGPQKVVNRLFKIGAGVSVSRLKNKKVNKKSSYMRVIDKSAGRCVDSFCDKNFSCM
jgi:hypothetical protein